MNSKFSWIYFYKIDNLIKGVMNTFRVSHSFSSYLRVSDVTQTILALDSSYFKQFKTKLS